MTTIGSEEADESIEIGSKDYSRISNAVEKVGSIENKINFMILINYFVGRICGRS